MATIVLQAAGAAIGTALGGPVGGILGRAAGALAGSAIDARLFGPGDTRVEGPRLDAARFLDSREGAPLPRLYGRARLSGQLIWATRFEEETLVESETAGGKASGPKTTRTTYSYFANFALALCEGEVAHLGRIWADGRLLVNGDHMIRLHRGTETQEADPLILAKQGEGAPAYRGTAYLVFERFALEEFGNRIPQIAAEVIRPVGGLSERLTAVNLIPGAGEFVYDPEPVVERMDDDAVVARNSHATTARTDWHASLDELQALAPKLDTVALVVSWFGDDLRAGECAVAPRVEVASRTIHAGEAWSVAELSQGTARLVSQVDGRPAFGGTPSDGAVRRAILDLKDRGLKVCFNPFLLMDIPPGNGLLDPGGAAEQPAFPWRGRITGEAEGVADFAAQWRAMVLHCAALCADVGGVHTFLLGSELRGLTRVRAADGSFPFVNALVALAGEVRAVLPDARISYAADWSEYGAYRQDDDVAFPLDALWADANVDFVGIDNYMPLADWRAARFDRPTEGRHANQRAMLEGNVAGGELFDWFYASDADREAVRRTPVTDGEGEPWIHRPKDLVGWWSNPHHERTGGVRASVPTLWVPGSKPVVFTELGCPALHAGANEPNLFFDPKSSESALPFGSTGERDDEASVAFLEAHAAHWNDAGNNPLSPVDGRSMVDFARTQVWTWDARPYPAFPLRDDVWGDAANWTRGHWLNGRLGAILLRDLLADLLDRAGIADADTSAVHGSVDGAAIAQDVSFRAMIEGLVELHRIAVHEEGGRLVFRSPGRDAVQELGAADLVADEEPVIAVSRRQVGELPREAVLEHLDPDRDFQDGLARTRRLSAGRVDRARLSLPVVLDGARAEAAADRWVHEIWGSREEATFAVARDRSDLAVGDLVRLPDHERTWRIARIEDGAVRKVAAVSVAPQFRAPPRDRAASRAAAAPNPVLPRVEVLDLPLLDAAPGPNGNRIAVASEPWAGPYDVLNLADGRSRFVQSVEEPATTGTLVTPLAPARPWRTSDVACEVVLRSGRIASAERGAVLDGANAVALRHADGRWEVAQCERAELVGERRYRLSGWLRGQAGTEDLAVAELDAGTQLVRLDRAVVPLDLPELDVERSANLAVVSRRSGLRAAGSFALGERSLTPFAPVHPRLSGSHLSWTRRDRGLADSWLPADVPLSETGERYRVEVGAEAFETDEPRIDLGSAPEPGTIVSVRQISSVVGAGDALSFTVPTNQGEDT